MNLHLTRALCEAYLEHWTLRQARNGHGLRKNYLLRRMMTDELLSTSEAAQQLGISRATLYDWFAQSDAGTFVHHCPNPS
jgi:transcriptional regulator with PAS, ATPase and Fis domain